MREGRRIELLVRVWIDEDADVMDVVSNLDYSFTHEAILDTVIEDVFYED